MCASRWSVCLHWHVRNVLRTCGSCFNKTNYQHYHMFCDCHHKRCIRYFFSRHKSPHHQIYLHCIYFHSIKTKANIRETWKRKALCFLSRSFEGHPWRLQGYPLRSRTSYWFPESCELLIGFPTEKNDLWLIAGFWLNTISLKLINFIYNQYMYIYRDRERYDLWLFQVCRSWLSSKILEYVCTNFVGYATMDWGCCLGISSWQKF